MIKAVFFDVDGTLLPIGSGKIPQSAQTSLKKLKENGTKIFLSTGRHANEIHQMSLDDLSFDGYISLNGQLCLDENFEVVFGNPIDPKGTEELLNIFREKSVSIVLTREKDQCINFVSDLAAEVMANIAVEIPEASDVDDSPIYQATTFYRNDSNCWFNYQCPTGCKITRWCDGAVDILSEKGGKVIGINEYIKRLGITKDEIMAFGDAENDVEMLEYAAIGVAMGNGKEAAKTVADYVTASVEEDGIEKALKYYDLI